LRLSAWLRQPWRWLVVAEEAEVEVATEAVALVVVAAVSTAVG
jgi:hypothetical protein